MRPSDSYFYVSTHSEDMDAAEFTYYGCYAEGAPGSRAIHAARTARALGHNLDVVSLAAELAELRNQIQQKEAKLAERRREDQEEDIECRLASDEPSPSEVEDLNKIQNFTTLVAHLHVKLQSLADAVRPLGASLEIFSAVHRVKTQLKQVYSIFHDNAQQLVGNVYGTRMPGIHSQTMGAARQYKASDGLGGPYRREAGGSEHLPEEIELLAIELRALLDSLNGISEYRDEAISGPILEMETDLKYHASCLRDFKGKLNSPGVSRHINDLTVDLGTHIDTLILSLTIFIQAGVPMVAAQQKVTTARLQNLSTVATFLSAVTATMLQFSFGTHGNTLADAVNVLWFSSLVFSIASTINSQLAYFWQTTMYCPSKVKVPWWLGVWARRTPLLFLVCAVITFLGGLCAFTYSSNQSPIVTLLVTVLTVFTSLSLLLVGIWLALERLMFARTGGHKTLSDLIAEQQDTSKQKLNNTSRLVRDTARQILASAGTGIVGVITWMHGAWTWSMKVCANSVSRVTGRRMGGTPEPPRIRRDSMDTAAPLGWLAQNTYGNGEGSNAHCEQERPISGTGLAGAMNDIHEAITAVQSETNKDAPGEELDVEKGSVPNLGTEKPKPRVAAFMDVIKRLLSTPGHALPPQYRERGLVPTTSNTSIISVPHDQHDSNECRANHMTHIQSLVNTLRGLAPNQTLREHVALVKHLQFSPDGQFLATCSLDQSALIWKVGLGPNNEFKVLHKLAHTSRVKGFVRQFAWSPTGDWLLAKHLDAVKVWDPKTGECKKTIRRKRNVQSIAWSPKSSWLVSIEWETEASGESIIGSYLIILSVDGTVIADNHYLKRLQVWDVVVTPNEERVVVVASLIRSSEDLKPVHSRSEKRILIYNLKTMEIEDQVPVMQEVRHISSTGQGNCVLVSYEGNAPPQAWQIHTNSSQLIPAHTYSTKHPVNYLGPSHFGDGDKFIVCGSKDGNIHIWDKGSGMLLHSLKAPEQELTSIAWNCKSSNGLMFASAARDGTVQIWATVAPFLLAFDSAPSPESAKAESSGSAQSGSSLRRS